MAYIDPGDFSPSTSLPAASLEIISNDIRWLHDEALGLTFAGVSLYASRTSGGVGWSNIPWSSETIDTPTGWWAGAGNSAIVVPVNAIPSGATQIVVECQLQARFAVNATGSRGVGVTLNGATVESTFSTSAIASDYTVVNGTFWAICSAGDTLKGEVNDTSGDGALAYVAYMHVKRIGSL